MLFTKCDCEMEGCKAHTGPVGSSHQVGDCRFPAQFKITVFGLAENLCEACLYQVNADVIEKVVKL